MLTHVGYLRELTHVWGYLGKIGVERSKNQREKSNFHMTLDFEKPHKYN